MQNLCPQCGAPIQNNTGKCEYCGAVIPAQQPAPQQPVYQQPVYQQPVYQQPAQNQNLPVKSKIAAGLLALFLGGLGIHKFYLGKTGAGILYLLLCWTYIPGIIAFIEGIIILCSSDAAFMSKYNCRIS